MSATYVVTEELGGRWAVRQEGSRGASRIYDQRDAALTAAVELARTDPPGRVRVYGIDGRLEDERVYTASGP
jgi:hypothetical protein